MQDKLNYAISRDIFPNSTYFEGFNYDYIIASRSDIKIGNNFFPSLLEYIPHYYDSNQEKNNNNKKTNNSIWLMGGERFGPYEINDRLIVFTTSSFYNYQLNFIDRIEAFLRLGIDCHGETITGAILNQISSKNEIYDLKICYEVMRRTCNWTGYGTDSCLEFFGLDTRNSRAFSNYICPAYIKYHIKNDTILAIAIAANGTEKNGTEYLFNKDKMTLYPVKEESKVNHVNKNVYLTDGYLLRYFRMGEPI